MSYSKPKRECDFILHDMEYEYKFWLINFASETDAMFVYVSSGFNQDNDLSQMKISDEDIFYRHRDESNWNQLSFDIDGEEEYLNFLMSMQACIREIENTLLGET